VDNTGTLLQPPRKIGGGCFRCYVTDSQTDSAQWTFLIKIGLVDNVHSVNIPVNVGQNGHETEYDHRSMSTIAIGVRFWQA